MGATSNLGSLRMRFIFGIIVGVALTIGGAYLHDRGASSAGDPSRRALVNWDTARALVDAETAFLRQLWTKVVGR